MKSIGRRELLTLGLFAAATSRASAQTFRLPDVRLRTPGGNAPAPAPSSGGSSGRAGPRFANDPTAGNSALQASLDAKQRELDNARAEINRLHDQVQRTYDQSRRDLAGFNQFTTGLHGDLREWVQLLVTKEQMLQVDKALADPRADKYALLKRVLSGLLKSIATTRSAAALSRDAAP